MIYFLDFYEKYIFPATAIIVSTFSIRICAILLSFIFSIKVNPFNILFI